MKLGNWALSCLSVMFSGCAVVSSTDVNPSTIYSQYSAKYDEATNKLEFNASFFVGGDTGTYVELSDKSSVMLDARPMVKNKTIINQIIYESDRVADSQSLLSAYAFAYTNDLGSVYRNSVQIPSRVSIAALQSITNSITSGFSVTWQTPSSVGVDENIQAVLKASNFSAAQSSWAGGTSGQIEFSPQELKGFTPGPATLTVCRENYTTNVQGPAAGGSINTSYCSAPVNLTLTQ